MNNKSFIEIKDINGNRHIINLDEIIELNSNRIVVLLKNDMEYLIKINSRQYNIIRNSLCDPYYNKRELEYYKRESECYKRRVELFKNDNSRIREILDNYHKLKDIFITKKDLKHFLKQIEGIINNYE